MEENPNRAFLNWAVSWLKYHHKAKNNAQIATSINYETSSMSAALKGLRSFPDEKLNELIQKYGLQPYWEKFRVSPTVNPFGIDANIVSTPTVKGDSLIDKVAQLEATVEAQGVLIHQLHMAIRAAGIKLPQTARDR